MTRDELKLLKNRFADYVSAFISEDGILNPVLQLKLEHSEIVAREAYELSSDLHWAASDRLLASALGLFHDIGRFSQFSQFGTFSDAASVDHGKQGRKVAVESGLFSVLADFESDVLLNGIAHHNKREVPKGLPVKNLHFLSLIRDCDKLDIYRIVLASVKKDGFKDLSVMLPDVKLDRVVGYQMVEEFRRGRSCSFSCVETLGDFLLMQLSWIYDMSYEPTLRKVVDRGILNDLLANIEFRQKEHDVATLVSLFMDERLK